MVSIQKTFFDKIEATILPQEMYAAHHTSTRI